MGMDILKAVLALASALCLMVGLSDDGGYLVGFAAFGTVAGWLCANV